MSIEVTSQNIKSIAKNLKSVLSDYQLALKHSQSLEILAKTFGFKDWNTFSAKLNEVPQTDSSPDQTLSAGADGVLAAESTVNGRHDKKRREYFETAVAGMNFVLISAGQVQMSEDYTAEITKDFSICDHPVTCREFNPYLMDRGKRTGSRSLDDCPVVDVSWINARDYIAWLNSFADKEMYRLPTEAEWEYACRAGSTTRYSFGDSNEDLSKYCWYAGNSGGRLQPVKQLLPNPWGLYDMHGNVSEWMNDNYGNYPNGHVQDPTGAKSGMDRVLRGGAWNWGAVRMDLSNHETIVGLGSADRNGSSPHSCRDFIGFRLVKQGL